MLKKMLTKIAVAAAVASALVVAAPVAGEAKTSIKIFIGSGYWTGPGYYGGRYRDRMSCWEGAYIVDHSGFNYVQPLDCRGRYYEYRARQRGLSWIVKMDSWWGNIIRVQRD